MKKWRILAAIICMTLLIGCNTKETKEGLAGFEKWSLFEEDYLTELRETYKLDELTADCQTEYEKTLKIIEWVSGLWEHDGNNIPEQWDPLYILDQVVNHGKRYRCVEYGTVIYGCLQSIGIESRMLGLKMETVETEEYGAGHVACEVYLKDIKKWAFIDGQWGAIPMLGEIPLNAYEFGKAIRNNDSDLYINWVNNVYNASDQDYFGWIEPYLFYLDTTYKNVDGGETSIMFVPEGGKEVTIFQRDYEIDVDIYLTDIDMFYYE